MIADIYINSILYIDSEKDPCCHLSLSKLKIACIIYTPSYFWHKIIGGFCSHGSFIKKMAIADHQVAVGVKGVGMRLR